MIVGVVCGIVALLFFMALVFMSAWGRVVPHGEKYLVIIVLALSGSLSAGLIGGNASARGVIQIPFVEESPLTVAFTGAVNRARSLAHFRLAAFHVRELQLLTKVRNVWLASGEPPYDDIRRRIPF
jgi:hypothetical protein